MKSKILILTTLFAVAFLLSVIQASAIAATQTINLTTPAASSIITGTINLVAEVNGTNQSARASASGNPNTANITNVTFQYTVDAGTTWVNAISNGSNPNNGTLSNWTVGFSTLHLNDTDAFQWRALAQNGTNGGNTVMTSLTVTINRVDNTIPVVSGFLQSANTMITSDPTTISATAINASICILKFGSNPATYNMTKSGNTCSYSLSKNVVPDATYDVLVTAGDGFNSSNRGQSYTVSLLSSDAIAQPGIGGASATGVGKAAVQVQQQKQEFSLTTIAVVIIAGLVVINGKKLGLFK